MAPHYSDSAGVMPPARNNTRDVSVPAAAVSRANIEWPDSRVPTKVAPVKVISVKVAHAKVTRGVTMTTLMDGSWLSRVTREPGRTVAVSVSGFRCAEATR